jgi:hypothetical protein
LAISAVAGEGKLVEMMSRQWSVRPLVIMSALLVPGYAASEAKQATFDGQPAIALSNGKLDIVVTRLGSTLASIVMTDDPEKLNPLWDPARIAREQGRQAAFTGSAGHFVCVDGFGPPSVEERAAGLPMHGEAHNVMFEISAPGQSNSADVTFTGTLPVVQEKLQRRFRMVKGESVVYVDSELENLMGFDRPINWGEHATIMAPFLEPNVTTIYLSGTRSQNRDYLLDQTGRSSSPRGGNAVAAPAQDPSRQRRLAPGKDFTWPMAPGLDGEPVDLSSAPDDAHFVDHATTLLDPSRTLEWVAALNTKRRAVYGYLFRREDYRWLQHWDSYPNTTALVRGMEFATQPYDIPRRDVVDMHSLFDAPVYRWLPAKSKIASHYLLYYAKVPEGFTRIDDVHLENGRLIIEDHATNKQVTLAASRGLQ